MKNLETNEIKSGQNVVSGPNINERKPYIAMPDKINRYELESCTIIKTTDGWMAVAVDVSNFQEHDATIGYGKTPNDALEDLYINLKLKKQ